MPNMLGKKFAAAAAASYVKEGMIIGIGTGSTVVHFIDELAKLHKLGLFFEVVCSSQKSTHQAKASGLRFADEESLRKIDLTVDGADQIDEQKRMIKGGGGALLREKILAYSSQEVIIIVDESKYHTQLVGCKVPLEILPFAFELTLARIYECGFKGRIRKEKDSFFLTDNHNFILDLEFDGLIEAPEQKDLSLRSIPGVLETGFFFNLAKKVIIGYENGKVETRS